MKKIRFWVLPNNGFQTAPLVGDLLKGFHWEHPGLEVEVEVKTPASLWRHLFRSLKNRDEERRPDLVQIPHTWTAILAHLSFIEDLKGFDSALDLDAWVEPLRTHCQLPGVRGVYALPWWMELSVLFYRHDVLSQVAADPQKELDTWEGFLEVCRKIHKRLKSFPLSHVVANPNPNESVSLIDAAPCVWACGGEFLSRDGSRALFYREEVQRGVDAYLQLMLQGAMPLLSRSGLVPRGFFEGACAMQFGPRFPKMPKKLSRAVRAVPYPRGGRARSSIVGAQHLAVVRDNGQAREAFECLKYLAKPANALAYGRSAGGIPARLADMQPFFGEHENVQEAFAASLGFARLLPNFPIMGTLEKIFERMMERVVENILHRKYSAALLREELIHAAAEVDYILALND